MKAVFSVVVLAAMTLRLSAQNFTIKGHFTDVANDTLSIGYVQREPEKRIVDVDARRQVHAVAREGRNLHEEGRNA